jgi:hypothetical protein
MRKSRFHDAQRLTNRGSIFAGQGGQDVTTALSADTDNAIVKLRKAAATITLESLSSPLEKSDTTVK